MRLRVTSRRQWGVAGLALVAGTVVLAGGPGGHGDVGAGLAVLVLGVGAERSLRGLVAAIATGALVAGVIGWLVASLVVGSVAPPLAAGLGVAVGGGLGSVAWLLAVGDEQEDETEEVTVDMQGSDAAPAPEPADLFEASPDPILYYGGDGDLVVRAANPAFAEVFGEQSDDLEGRPLESALFLADGAGTALDAARQGRPLDERATCETASGPGAFRVRVAPTGTGGVTAGYVIYGPADTAE